MTRCRSQSTSPLRPVAQWCRSWVNMGSEARNGCEGPTEPRDPPHPRPQGRERYRGSLPSSTLLLPAPPSHGAVGGAVQMMLCAAWLMRPLPTPPPLPSLAPPPPRPPLHSLLSVALPCALELSTVSLRALATGAGVEAQSARHKPHRRRGTCWPTRWARSLNTSWILCTSVLRRPIASARAAAWQRGRAAEVH